MSPFNTINKFCVRFQKPTSLVYIIDDGCNEKTCFCCIIYCVCMCGEPWPGAGTAAGGARRQMVGRCARSGGLWRGAARPHASAGSSGDDCTCTVHHTNTRSDTHTQLITQFVLIRSRITYINKVKSTFISQCFNQNSECHKLYVSCKRFFNSKILTT